MYSLLTLVALAEVGVTAYLVDHFTRTGYPTSRYRSLTIFLLFNACWTAFFGLAYIIFVAAGKLKGLARLTASLAWLTITALLWLIAASLYTDPVRGGRGEVMCWNLPALDICRKTQAAQALAWTAFAFSIVTMIVSMLSWHEDRPPPTSTTVSDSIFNNRFERWGLNVPFFYSAKTRSPKSRTMNGVQHIARHLCFPCSCRLVHYSPPILCYHKHKIYIPEPGRLTALLANIFTQPRGP